MDYLILLLYCLLALFRYPALPDFVAAFFLAVCISAFLYVYPSDKLCLILTASYSLLLFFLPEALLMLPLAFYSYRKPSGGWEDFFTPEFLFPAILCILGVLFQTHQNPGLFLPFYVFCGCLLSVVLFEKTTAYHRLSEKYKKTRDDGTEIALLLEEKNKSLLDAQDAEIYTATLKERNRIAREIHDNVGHLLTRSILLVGALKAIHPEDSLKTPLAQLDDTLNDAMTSIRESVHDLHDRSVDLSGSLTALTNGFLFCPVTLHYDMTPEVPAEVRYCFIAVTKEALSNISRHSNATKASVAVTEHPAFYQLSIRDNGRKISGALQSERDINSSPSAPQRGIGLSNMKARIDLLHGTFRINTEHGFHIFVTIPKQSSQKEGKTYANFTGRR